MKTIKQQRLPLLYILTGLSIGFAAGYLLLRSPQAPQESPAPQPPDAQVWTCSMHPQIRQDKPGKCPLCAMDLIPLKTADAMDPADDPGSIALSPEAVALADVRTAPVSRTAPVKEVRLYGTIQPDERLARSQVAHAPGRIEELFVRFTGETIRRGQTIATLYSPDLLNAQQELLEAARMRSVPLLEAAREKLRLLKLPDSRIEAIEQSGETSAVIDIAADTEGVVTARKVSQGDYVATGSVLFELVDLSTVWAMFDAYEADLPFLQPGAAVAYTLTALPGRTYTGRIAFIDPSLHATTRTAKVRVETANPGLLLKPGMYAQGIVAAPLGGKGGSLVVPRTAVLWTGKRSIVYVKRPDAATPVFSLREIELGPSLGDAYVVLSGLAEGEEIVSSGVFAVDAAAQLEGRRSMMNNDPPASAGGVHTHLAVEGLCEMCKERIEKAAQSVKGVIFASWNMETKQLHLEYDPQQTSAGEVARTVARSGHDAGAYKAAAEVYDALPDCCKYRH